MASLTKAELLAATAALLGGDVTALPTGAIQRLMTITQHATDIMLNELERRDELEFVQDLPVVPYVSEYMVETILTRG